MNILITGGAGFIGSHLAGTLIRAGHDVTVVDDLSTGSIENISAYFDTNALEFVQENIVDSEALPALVRNADCIFHLAATVGVELVVHEPIRTIMTNVAGAERVLTLAAEEGKRILLTSTSEVYGKSTHLPFRESDDLLIGAPTHSRWSYACSKLLDEFMLLAYHRDAGLPGTIVRLFNTVGPRQTGQYGMVIPRFVEAALKNRPLRVYGTGEQTRCFCHVSDTVRALCLIAEMEDTFGEIINIGNTAPITIRALAERVVSLLGSKSEIVHDPYDKAYEPGFEDMLQRVPDCSKIADLCGWRAEIPLDEIILDVAAYLRAE